MGVNQKRLARVIVEHEDGKFFVLDPQSRHGKLGPFGVTARARRFAVQASNQGVFSFVAINTDTNQIWMVKVGNEKCSFIHTKKPKKSDAPEPKQPVVRPVVQEEDDDDGCVDMDEL